MGGRGRTSKLVEKSRIGRISFSNGDAVGAYRGKAGLLIQAAALGVGTHAFNNLIYVCAARALGVELGIVGFDGLPLFHLGLSPRDIDLQRTSRATFGSLAFALCPSGSFSELDSLIGSPFQALFPIK